MATTRNGARMTPLLVNVEWKFVEPLTISIVPLFNVNAPRRIFSRPFPSALVTYNPPPEMLTELLIEVAALPTNILLATTEALSATTNRLVGPLLPMYRRPLLFQTEPRPVTT